MPIQTASITPFHADAAKKDILFHDRIVKAQRETAHYVVHMHAPRSGESAHYIRAARRLLDEKFADTGDVRGDLLRALIPVLIDYVPEYARIASYHSHNGGYVCMPSVTFSLTDGQLISVGRPDTEGGVAGVPADRLTALQLNKPAHVGTSGPRPLAQAPARSIRNLDSEFLSQTVPGFDADRFKPVVEVLATLLAATDGMRNKIVAMTDPSIRDTMPNGPLRTKPLTL